MIGIFSTQCWRNSIFTFLDIYISDPVESKTEHLRDCFHSIRNHCRNTYGVIRFHLQSSREQEQDALMTSSKTNTTVNNELLDFMRS